MVSHLPRYPNVSFLLFCMAKAQLWARGWIYPSPSIASLRGRRFVALKQQRCHIHPGVSGMWQGWGSFSELYCSWKDGAEHCRQESDTAKMKINLFLCHDSQSTLGLWLHQGWFHPSGGTTGTPNNLGTDVTGNEQKLEGWSWNSSQGGHSKCWSAAATAGKPEGVLFPFSCISV